jgi:hypothetical protein
VSNPASNDPRSPEQIARESAMGEVSDVLLNLEHTIARSKKAIERSRKAGGNPNVEFALQEALTDLQRINKRLMHDTYYAGDSLRLI